MQHYKVPNDPKPHALSLDQIAKGFESILPEGFVRITDDEADAMRAANVPKLTSEEATQERNSRLAASDWTDTLSAKERLGQAVYDAWQVYRQALRDVPEQTGFPESVIWPTAPN
jgi:hypothetical protein